jgi:hypothetical protein
VRGPKSAPVEGEHELFGFLTTEAGRSASSFTQFLTDGARPVCMGPPRRPAPAGAFLAASEPLQDHCSPNPLASAAPPTDGGFFMTTKPARCRCSTSRLATGTRDYGNTKHGE